MAPRIVVGVDGSDTSRKALIWASRHAASAGAELSVVMTWYYPTVAYTAMAPAVPMPPQPEMQTNTEAALDAFVHDSGVSDVAHTNVVVEGAAGRVLCDMSANADLLVVGSRGLGGFSGLMLGSVGAHCANVADCPVAIVPDSWDPDAPPTGEVLVGVDGSPNARQAVMWADRWVQPDVTLRILNSWDFPLAYTTAGLEIDRSMLEEACQQTVREAAELVADHDVVTECVHGDARNVLATHAAKSQMLVIGARGHSGLSRLLLGSVASTVVHHLTVPTVLVPASTK